MNIVVDKQPKCVATLRVEIPADKVQGQRNLIVRKYTSKASIQGFRPGKAPQAIVEKRYHKEITEELNELLFNEAFDEALKQESLKVLDFGMPEDLTNLPDGSMTFVSKITLAPEVQLPDYKGVTVTVPPLAVPEDDVNAQLKGLQERFADFKDIEDRATAMGDFAVIDYTSTVDGKPTKESLGKSVGYLNAQEGFWVRLNEEAFLPGFAAQLEGMKVGETKEITITLPEDFPVVVLRSQTMVFSTTLMGHKEAILPELDDALAERLFPGKTIAEITDMIRENMAIERKRKIEDMKVNQIVAHFNDQVDFELPDELVTQETQNQADSIVRRGVQYGMTEDEIESQQTEIFANANQLAVTNLRTNFMLQEIASVEKITVSDQELVNHLLKIAESRKVSPKKFVKDMQRSGRIPSLRSSIAVGKTIDFLVSQANVVESEETAITED